MDRAHNSKDLSTCANLANRTKHLELLPRGQNADLTSRNVSVQLGPNPPITTYSHIVTLDDGSQIVAQELAERIVTEWESILADEGLNTS